MKKLLIVVLAIMLGGCSDTVSPSEMERAVGKCSSLGGLQSLQKSSTSSGIIYTALCKEGSRVRYNFRETK